MIEDRALTERVPSPSAVERGYLLRYRILAFTTATLLIILVFAGLPLQFAAHAPEVANLVGTLHGFLYLVYLFVAFQLTRRLRIPKWKMALVLLAGTVPFCAFIAERSLTKRFSALLDPERAVVVRRRADAGPGWRQRWLSRRALLLHGEVAIVAPGCAAAGWWQATRALAGNALSWVYSFEWPLFALLALIGWWYLIHEDPLAYAARKRRPLPGPAPHVQPERALTVERFTARLATALAVLVIVEFGLGVAALATIPSGRPSGFVPRIGSGLYVIHASLAVPLVIGGALLIGRVARSTRMARLSGWIGAVGVGVAGLGGLLCAPASLRLLGIGVMFIGAAVAGFGYFLPVFERLER